MCSGTGMFPKYPESDVERVCAAAAASNSVAQCDKCERAWSLPDIAPATAPNSWSSLFPKEKRQTLAWFTCVTKPKPSSSSWPDGSNSLNSIFSLKAAIVSARLNAPSLAPYVLYMNEPHQPLIDDDYTKWLRAAGARVILHRLSFLELIPSARQLHPNVGINQHVNIGTYGRMDVPQVAISLLAEFRRRGNRLLEALPSPSALPRALS